MTFCVDCHFLFHLFYYDCTRVHFNGLINSIKTPLIPSDTCRTVNGLLKTALGPPAGSTTTLSPIQDVTFRLESVKCLVRIIKSMGIWMDQEMKVGESNQVKSDNENLMETPPSFGEEGNLADYELHSEVSSEFSDTATLEQRRAYKLEIQVS